MSFKLVLGFVFFGILSVYIAFLNPQDIDLRLAQSYSLKIPIIVLLLGSIVIGVLIISLGEGFRLIRSLPAILRLRFQSGRREALLRKCEKLYEEAENTLIGGNIKKAGALFEKVLSLHSDHIPSLNYLGEIMRQEGKLDQALKMHTRAVSLAPQNVKIHCKLAEDYSALSQYEKEAETLQQAQNHAPDSLTLLRKERDAWLKIPDWKQAAVIQKSILRIALHSDKDLERRRLGEIIYGSAISYYGRGDGESAKAELKRAIKESNSSLPPFVTLGDIYFKEDRRKDALKIWKAGYNKTTSPVCLQRIRGVGDEGVIKLCESAIRTSRSSRRNDVAVLLATMFMEKGEIDRATQILEDTSDNASLLHQILLITVRQASNCNGQLPDALHAIFRKIEQALSNYTCNTCLASLPEWASHCPSCKAWDSVVWEPQALNAL